MAQQVVGIRLDCLVSGDMTRRNLTFGQAVSYVGNHIAGKRNCQTSQLGRAPPHGKKCLIQPFRETTMRFKCELCQTLTLFAMDAKYHRSCYSHYISLNNMNAASARAKVDKSHNACDFKSLCKDIEETVMSKTTSITTLSVLNE